MSHEDEGADELERQARAMIDTFRETAGDLGTRVREVMEYASEVWAQASPVADAEAPETSAVSLADELRARALARRWAAVDFLVDPDVPAAMSVRALRVAALWRVELRERGESRAIVEASEPYRGERPAAPGPILPPWDYAYPAVPEIEAGERRECLTGTEIVGACATCNGSGHRPCTVCAGKGFVPCPSCHGRAKTPCRRCRGRGRIADAAAERRARAGKSYFQVHAERLAAEAAGRVADFAERLRQEHGVPLPPSAQWAPLAPASGVTVPCPDCLDGSVPCTCDNGKVPCKTCMGSAFAECPACGASGRVVRHRELVRRFDTQIAERVLPPETGEVAEWFTQRSLRRSTGEEAWAGRAGEMGSVPPEGVPAPVWAMALELAGDGTRALPGRAGAQDTARDGERRILSRDVRVLRVPLVHVDYTFAGQPFAFVAAGTSGAEHFWASTFPSRWSRLGRFLQALARDGRNERPQRPPHVAGEISTLEDYRARRMQAPPHQAFRVTDAAGSGAAEGAAPPPDAEPGASLEE